MGSGVLGEGPGGNFMKTRGFLTFCGYFVPQKLFLISEVILKNPPKMSFKTSTKITSRGYFLFFEVIF